MDISKELRDNTPASIVSIINTHMARSAAAKKKIDLEGVVVRDQKGSVIQHPAIKVEIDANKIVHDMVDKYKASKY
jgi:ABC-type Na+ transport system ATPase subunit NatA